MDVDALSKGSGKGNSKGKKGKDQNHMSNVKCWNCGKSGHCGRNCREMWWSKDQGKSKGKLNNAESSNWQEGWLERKPQSYREQDEEHVDGRWMTANDQTPWETEDPKGGFEISSTEGGWSKGPRWCKEQRMRRWQRPREETVSVRTRDEGTRVLGEISSGRAAHSSSATVEMNAQTKKRHAVISPEQT